MTTAQLNAAMTFGNRRTYAFATLFIAGNIILPQMAHLIPQGGITWLPIYFFTLIGAWLYGWRVGLLTAVASPLVNCAIFGMPAPEALPAILAKSVVLAVAASQASRYAARRGGILTLLLAVFSAVMAYQAVGGLFEWAVTGSLSAAVQDFTIGLPGILFQLIGGTALLATLRRDR